MPFGRSGAAAISWSQPVVPGLAVPPARTPDDLSLAFGAEGEWLTVQTARPDEFYGALLGVAEDAGVREMYSPDEDLASVFKYLVPR